MNDRRIEDMLKRAYQPQPPEGMRERVLAGNRNSAPRFRRAISVNWKTALAGLAIGLVMYANASDRARTERIAAMSGYGVRDMLAAPEDLNEEMRKWNRRLVANTWADSSPLARKGDDLP